MTMLSTTNGHPATLYNTNGQALFGRSDESAVTDPADLTRLAHVVDQCAWWRNAETTGPGGATLISEHNVLAPARALRLAYGGQTSTLRGRAGIHVRGFTHWVTWGGSPTVTISPGEGVVSDPIPDRVVVRPGEKLHVLWQSEESQIIPLGAHGMPDGTFTQSRVGRITSGVPAEMTSSGLSGSPVGVYGLTDPATDRSVGMVGDSWFEVGWGKLAAKRVGLAWADLSQWGETTPTQRERIRNRLPLDDSPFRFIVSCYGGNDSRNPLADQQATHIASWRMLAATGAKVAAMTLHPYTSSTDSWTTLEGQTPVPERRSADRIARNDWLRDGAPLNTETWEPYEAGSADVSAVRAGGAGHPLAFPAFDQADASESSRNSGLWRVDYGPITADGTHLRPAGVPPLADAFEAYLRAQVVPLL